MRHKSYSVLFSCHFPSLSFFLSHCLGGQKLVITPCLSHHSTHWAYLTLSFCLPLQFIASKHISFKYKALCIIFVWFSLSSALHWHNPPCLFFQSLPFPPVPVLCNTLTHSLYLLSSLFLSSASWFCRPIFIPPLSIFSHSLSLCWSHCFWIFLLMTACFSLLLSPPPPSPAAVFLNEHMITETIPWPHCWLSCAPPSPKVERWEWWQRCWWWWGVGCSSHYFHCCYIHRQPETSCPQQTVMHVHTHKCLHLPATSLRFGITAPNLHSNSPHAPVMLS